MIIPIDRFTLRRKSVPAFVRQITARHPELSEPVTYETFLTIAAREQITVRIVRLSRPARLIRLGRYPCVQFDVKLTGNERAIYGMHELCHFWRDDPDEPCYNAEDSIIGREEEFADIFAWVVTSPAGIFLRGMNDEDF